MMKVVPCTVRPFFEDLIGITIKAGDDFRASQKRTLVKYVASVLLARIIDPGIRRDVFDDDAIGVAGRGGLGCFHDSLLLKSVWFE